MVEGRWVKRHPGERFIVQMVFNKLGCDEKTKIYCLTSYNSGSDLFAPSFVNCGDRDFSDR